MLGTVFGTGSADWPSFAGMLAQMTGVGGMSLTAVIAAHVFGREYADGTAKNLLALPVRREWFVVAKLLVVALWFAVLVAAMFVEGVAHGGKDEPMLALRDVGRRIESAAPPAATATSGTRQTREKGGEARDLG